MGRRAIDLTGQVFGQLTVIERNTEKDSSGQATWVCQCSCGKKAIVRGFDLRSGKSKSCGCLSNKIILGRKPIDISNQRFGRLIALYPTDKRSGNSIVWHCKCDCGNECDISSQSLRSGLTQSCGCLNKERASETHKKDISNQRFGRLTALYPTDKKSGSSIVWHCRCDCGAECDIILSSLMSGNTSSCGCIKSKGELMINKILQSKDIKYECQYKRDDCRYSKTNREFVFDFALFDNSDNLLCVIEFNGIQHYHSGLGWNTKEHFEETVRRDNEKYSLCESLGIPLHIIRYDEDIEEAIENILSSF